MKDTRPSTPAVLEGRHHDPAFKKYGDELTASPLGTVKQAAAVGFLES
jgi:hypothetical protein